MVDGAVPSKGGVASDSLVELGLDYCQGVRDIVTKFVELGCGEVMFWGPEKKNNSFWIVQRVMNKVPSLTIFLYDFWLFDGALNVGRLSRCLFGNFLECKPSPFRAGRFLTVNLLFLLYLWRLYALYLSPVFWPFFFAKEKLINNRFLFILNPECQNV